MLWSLESLTNLHDNSTTDVTPTELCQANNENFTVNYPLIHPQPKGFSPVKGEQNWRKRTKWGHSSNDALLDYKGMGATHFGETS